MIRAISYGGGVQSTALLVLAAQGEIDYRLALFANVGDDSENPATITYFHEYAKPYADRHGIELVTVQKKRRDGSHDTLLQQINRVQRSVPIPMRMSGNGAPGNRSCTFDFKINPIAKETKRRGATVEQPATIALGISLDEYQRMRTDLGIAWQRPDYPLIERRVDRAGCKAIIERAGLPVPPKSSCWWCPFKTGHQWKEMRRDQPELFAAAADLERRINSKRDGMERDHVWLTSALKPLEEAFADDGQMEMFGPGCDIAGHCHV